MQDFNAIQVLYVNFLHWDFYGKCAKWIDVLKWFSYQTLIV